MYLQTTFILRDITVDSVQKSRNVSFFQSFPLLYLQN